MTFMKKKITEAMTIACEDDNKGYFLFKNFDEISEKFEWADAVIIGPGIGAESQTVRLAEKIIMKCVKRMWRCAYI